MSTICKKCGNYIDGMTVYPHINLLKRGIDISEIPIEIIEELPKPHLHQFYKCDKCNFIEALEDLHLLSEEEHNYSEVRGIKVSPRRTLAYWKEWLNKQGK